MVLDLLLLLLLLLPIRQSSRYEERLRLCSSGFRML
jgi:hypothetical protein